MPCLPKSAQLGNPMTRCSKTSRGLAIKKQMGDRPDRILAIDEVAAYLKAGKRTVYRHAASGELPAFKLGGTWPSRRGELDRWIARRIGKNANSGGEA